MASATFLFALVPRFDRRWVIGGLLVAVVVVAVRVVTTVADAGPPLELTALGADGRFHDTLAVPMAWRDTATTLGGVVRVPLVLGVRNTGTVAARPERLSLSLPVQYRLMDPGDVLDASTTPGSPLVTYTLQTGLGPVEPGRVPTLLPGHDTLWLEVVIPSYYCVSLADSVPEFIPAPPPPVGPLSEVTVFYAFEGGDLVQRRTGTLALRLDTALLAVRMPDPPPVFPITVDASLASPDLGGLRFGGSRLSRCGEPQDPMELRSTVWLTDQGGRVIVLEQGGVVRKRLYDLDGDGVIERESWDADGDGRFEVTRRARLPTPEFLLPVVPRGAGGAGPATS